MPVLNRFITGPDNSANPAGLRVLGAFFNIEVHVPPAIAKVLTDQRKPLPPAAVGAALVDTGATMSCVHEPILQGLGLNPIAVVQAGTAHGPVQQNVYPARFMFPAEQITVDFQGVAGVDLSGQAVPLDPPQPIIALIGRNILERWVLIWNGPGGYWTVAM